MSASQLTGAIAALLGVGAVSALSLGLITVAGSLSDPDGFLAEVVLVIGLFGIGVAAVLGACAWGVLRGARWAWQLAALAAGLMLISGTFGIGEARPPGATMLLELALAAGGAVLLVLLALRWRGARQ